CRVAAITNESQPGIGTAAEWQRALGEGGDRAGTSAVTFSHLFRAFAVPRHIDYLSLNADGAEDDLMATFPFETHTVSIVSVQRPSSQLMQLFRAQQYVYLCDCGLAGNMLFAPSISSATDIRVGKALAFGVGTRTKAERATLIEGPAPLYAAPTPIGHAAAGTGRLWQLPRCSKGECFSNEPFVRSTLPAMPLANGRSGAWHSSAQQDRAVLALLGAKRGGYFIDLTASDPVKDSNTLALERDYGWGGLCLEPRPYFQQRLTSTRSCTVVGVGVAKVEGTVPLTLERPFGARSPYSALENAVVAGREGEVARVLERLEAADYERESTVRAVTFAHLFRAFAVPRHIDYLTLNADGAEDDLMATFPFETHTVSIVSVQRPSSQLMQLFRAQQYVY
uniref:Methyltransferase FkbM domain-containing protein n=2 Tax=Emiliania huxleyi TaxID=2903 RepID=A0A0D3IQS8_EMIH1